MQRFYSFLMSMLVFMLPFAYAQQKTVTGRVTDEKGDAVLPGVTVRAKGMPTGTVTAADGTFRISVPADARTLVFTFIGYGDKEAGITGEELNVRLSTANKALSEVLVIGYGTQVKRDLTGAVSRIPGQELENFPAPSFESAMQGKAAGVVIASGSGKVGQGLKVRIRGTSSVAASSQPLYVIDGLPIQTQSQSDLNNEITNPVADINPDDIASIEVLKDAAAATIYGARAANGVILITTKKGAVGQKTAINLDVNSSWGKPSKKRDFLDATQYVELIQEAAANDGRIDFKNGINGFPTEQDAINAYKAFYEADVLDRYAVGTDWRNQEVNTDWQDEMFRSVARGNQVNLSASGGTDKTRFFASGFYDQQDAVVIVNRFTRYGGRLNLEHTATDKLSLGLNLSLARTQLDRVSSDYNYSTPGQLVAQVPISPVIDPATGQLNKRTLYGNGLIDAALNSNKQTGFRSLGNAYANYNFFPWLSFRTEFGADVLNTYEEAFIGKDATDGGGTGFAQTSSGQSVTYNTNNYFTVTPLLGEQHKLSAVLGMSYLQNDSKKTITQGEQFPSDAVKNLSGATSITFGGSVNDRYTFLSYFFRANYSFRDKYLAGISVRTDGSSRFGPDNRYGAFPAASLGWVISEEDFLKQAKALSFLKLRASYGLTGNAEIGEYQYLSLYYISNYPAMPGFIPYRLGNPGLHWEKTAQADVGLEFGLFGNRLFGELDYYNKRTSDLLLNVNIPSSTGYSTTIQNLGKMRNQGLEFTLSSVNMDGPFRWTTSFNIAYNKNKVTDLQGQVIENGQQRAVEGEAIGAFYLPKYMGVDPETGDALYMDKNGSTTNNYNQAVRQVVGNANPDFTGGLTNNFTYKGFDLGAFFTFVQGNEIYNRTGMYQSAGFSGGRDNQTTEILRRWQKPGDITDVPRVSLSYPTGQRASSRWIYDGSYIRLRTLTLGYTLPSQVLSVLKINSIRLYASGYNLWTRTDYISDPEVSSTPLGRASETERNVIGGVDYYTIPQARTYVLGLNVKF